MAQNKYRNPIELFNSSEDLNQELVPYLSEEDKLGTCLKHPLVFGVPYLKPCNGLYNEQLKCKKDRLDECLEKNEWDTYIWLHERPYRMSAFQDISLSLSDKEYWKILASIWTDTENQWQIADMLDEALQSNRPGREHMMDEEEKEFFDSLPNEFMIYRGHQALNQRGFSWTFSYWQACWFAYRWSSDGRVSQTLVNKKDVFAVLMGRNEFEVAAHPGNLKIELVKNPRKAKYLEKVLERAKNEFTLSERSVHGPWHWDKVERNVKMLCKTTNADELVCQLFAIFHDCKRENDNDDPLHGHRAAELVYSMKNELNLSPKRLELLVEACKYHNDGTTSSDPTIGTCWDADRLDLSRVGQVPDPQLLSTESAKNLIWRI